MSGGTVVIETELDDMIIGDCAVVEKGGYVNIRYVAKINCQVKQKPEHHVQAAGNYRKAKGKQNRAKTDDEINKAIIKVETLCHELIGPNTQGDRAKMTARNDHAQAILVVAFTGLVAMLLAACSTPPTTTYDDTTNFTPPKTFAWISEHPLKAGDGKQPVNPFLEQYLMEATRSSLKQKGYRFIDSASQADFSVAFSIGIRDKIRVDNYPGYVSVGRRGPVGGGYWGAGWGVGGTTTESYTEGQLSIDFFDQKTKKPVWHGSYSRQVTESDKKKLQEAVNQVVAKILSEFPPTATK